LIEGLIFEASDDDLVGIKTNKHDGGLRGSYGSIGNRVGVRLEAMFSNQPIEDLTLIEGLIFEASDDDLVGIKNKQT
jgi:hypothetical protein